MGVQVSAPSSGTQTRGHPCQQEYNLAGSGSPLRGQDLERSGKKMPMLRALEGPTREGPSGAGNLQETVGQAGLSSRDLGSKGLRVSGQARYPGKCCGGAGAGTAEFGILLEPP